MKLFGVIALAVILATFASGMPSAIRPHRGRKWDLDNLPELQIKGPITPTINKNSIGLVIYDPTNGNGRFPVQIFNADGSLWYEFSYSDDSRIKYDGSNRDFVPFGFSRDHYILELQCIAQEKDQLEVVVNEESGLTKFVKKNDGILKLKTWERYVLDRSTIEFDQNNNPLRTSPAGSLAVALTDEMMARPVSVEGDWVEIHWEPDPGWKTKDIRSGTGWIRWRRNGNILVEFLLGC